MTNPIVTSYFPIIGYAFFTAIDSTSETAPHALTSAVLGVNDFIGTAKLSSVTNMSNNSDLTGYFFSTNADSSFTILQTVGIDLSGIQCFAAFVAPVTIG